MGTPLLERRPSALLAATVLLTAALFGCQPETVGPGTPEQGPLRIHPVLMSSVDPEALDLDSIDVVIRRSVDEASVRETTLAYKVDAVLAWVLSLDDLPDMVDVDVRIRSASTPMFSGALEAVEVVEASPASPGVVYDVDAWFIGPGHDAVAVDVTPVDAVLSFGETRQFEALVTNADGDPIPDAILFWASSAPALAPVDGLGVLVAPDQRDGVEVTASTVTGVSGSTSVTFQPAVGELVVLEGDGAVAPVAAEVTITVQVLGADGLGLRDVDVAFEAPSGASVSDASVVSGPDGMVSIQATLGTTAGPYVFTAEAAGLEPVSVTMDAEPGEAAGLRIELNGSTATPGEALTPGVTVRVVDAYGNPTGGAVDVSMGLQDNPAGAVLSGTTQAASADGVATFTNLVLDRHGSGFTLLASSAGLTPTVSGPFDIVQAPESVEVTPAAAELQALEATAAFTAVARDGAGDPIEGQTFMWTSSDETVAVVDGAGVVSAVGNGTAVIQATAGGVTGSASVTVDQVVTSVGVSPTSCVLLALDDQIQLTAEGRDANGFPVAGAAFVWGSDAESVANVDDTGLVTAVANGQATVHATTSGVTGSATIEVAQAVAAVDVTPAVATLTALKDQVQLAAAATDANGHPVAGATFTWSSDAEDVASVDGTGLVTAGSNGAAGISAESDGVSGAATVTVEQEPVAVVVSPATATLTALEATVALSAEVVDANGFAVPDQGVTWSTPPGGPVTVDVVGVAAAVGNGTATVTASAGEISGTATVTVAQEAAAVVVTPAMATLTALEATVALSAEVVDANGFAVPDQSVTWSTPPGGSVTVDATGEATAVANGTATVTATATAGGSGGTATVTVAQQVQTLELSVSCYDSSPPAPSSGSGPALALSVPACDTLTAFGDQALVTADARDANGFAVADPGVAWTSLQPQIAWADVDGVVTAIDNGSATIRAEVDGIAAEVEIVVRQEVVDLTLEPAELALGVDDQSQLTALPVDANGFLVADATITWLSLDETTATVDGSGWVTGVAPGATHVQAIHEGLQAETYVTVY